MTAKTWIPTLLLIAALSFLPAWLAGCIALGAALGLWAAGKLEDSMKRRLEEAEKEGLDKLRKSLTEELSELPKNVVSFRRK